MFDIYAYSNKEIGNAFKDDINQWSIGLWWNDLEEAGVESTILVWDNNDIVGFQTVNIDGKTIAIEVKEGYQGVGIAEMMIRESQSYIPERNENPSFWKWALNKFEID